MTAHSPVGLDPAAFGVVAVGPDFGGFAHNDLVHEDPQGAPHELFAEGLRKSLFNYMHGICLDFELSEWFDFEVPDTTIDPHYIAECIANRPPPNLRKNALLVWLGPAPFIEEIATQEGTIATWTFYHKQGQWQMELSADLSAFLLAYWPRLSLKQGKAMPYRELRTLYEEEFGPFEELEHTELWDLLGSEGLLLL
ncbi:MAG: radical SAM protein, partial [Bacteroidota bacterium]